VDKYGDFFIQVKLFSIFRGFPHNKPCSLNTEKVKIQGFLFNIHISTSPKTTKGGT